MKYKEISEKYKLFQTWEIGLPDQEGWFNISSPKAVNKYLTVTKIGNRNQLTMEEEGEFAVLLEGERKKKCTNGFKSGGNILGQNASKR